MTARHARSLKSAGILFAGLLCLAGARGAQAQSPACMVDTDCPNSACGGDVCTHTSGSFACNEANTQAGKGFDGWCADENDNPNDALCKCKGLGARCVGFFCTFTIPSDAPMTGAGGASAGGSGGGSAGASGSTGTAGRSAGGDTGRAGSAAGMTGAAGGSATGGGGGGDGGGCSVTRAAHAPGSVALLLVVAALARRRRSGAVRQ